MGLFKIGFITILLSDSLVSGYTAAAAFTIMITQVKFLFGLPRELAAIPSGPFVTPKVSYFSPSQLPCLWQCGSGSRWSVKNLGSIVNFQPSSL